MGLPYRFQAGDTPLVFKPDFSLRNSEPLCSRHFHSNSIFHHRSWSLRNSLKTQPRCLWWGMMFRESTLIAILTWRKLWTWGRGTLILRRNDKDWESASGMKSRKLLKLKQTQMLQFSLFFFALQSRTWVASDRSSFYCCLLIEVGTYSL